VTTSNEHLVGLQELRHRTSEVLARVRRGETIDVTEYGRLIARIVPAEEYESAPVLDQLAAEGRVRAAVRPGYRPRMRTGDGTNRLGDAHAALRDEEA
jgi:prevent-host-death family protein